MKKIKYKKLNAQKQLWKCYESMARKDLIEICKEQHKEYISLIKKITKSINKIKKMRISNKINVKAMKEVDKKSVLKIFREGLPFWLIG